ncbi:STAS domain-containing protein [Acetobacter musti]|uniref:STAS domain-containing protein n=1 Tax=Acetobacter musti TaxID=864732 RepID=A0ABX0JRR4_9PROT|nr:ABC transporter permease [Acetobacter musti]NHN85871.1 STAS domain-containing protein [Acetobacter musti]
MTDQEHTPTPTASGNADSHDADSHPEWTVQSSANDITLVLRGQWTIDDGAALAIPDDALRTGAPKDGAAQTLHVDVSGLSQWDSSLVSFLWTVKQAAARGKMNFDLAQLPDGVQRLFALLPAEPEPPAQHPKKPFAPLRTTGALTLDTLDEIGALTELGAQTARGSVKALSGHGGMRLRDLFVNIFDAGPSALMIVSVVNFLVGAILAFVGAVQLRKFSADMYVANLVGIACVRELSAVMTAIIMAGRTGGAYAARIATMLGNEEIDALKVFGIPVSSYILLPSILSLMLMMPLLYLYGSGMSIIGGYVVATGMLPDVTGAGYINQTLGAIDLTQFEFGFAKSIVFAAMIGLTSCQIGLNAGRSAADVGTAATRAVVVGIVGVIALDAIFAVIANVLDI